MARRKKSYKTGGVIPKTGMYKLHEGELVVPSTMPMSPVHSASFEIFQKARKKLFRTPKR